MKKYAEPKKFQHFYENQLFLFLSNKYTYEVAENRELFPSVRGESTEFHRPHNISLEACVVLMRSESRPNGSCTIPHDACVPEAAVY